MLRPRLISALCIDNRVKRTVFKSFPIATMNVTTRVIVSLPTIVGSGNLRARLYYGNGLLLGFILRRVLVVTMPGEVGEVGNNEQEQHQLVLVGNFGPFGE